MKIVEKVAYIGFWINILLIIGLISIIFLALIGIQFFELVSSNEGNNPLNILYQFLAFFAFIHWIYCLWFLFKFDKYSKSLIPLLIFNVIYAPFYYYQVRIKKRPLKKDKIVKSKKVEPSEDKSEEIDDKEFEELTRNNLVETLKLFGSEDYLIELQRKNFDLNIVSELINQWNDFYLPESESIPELFTENELDLIIDFDKTLKEKQKTISDEAIEDLKSNPDWKIVNEKAKRTINEMK